MPTVVTYNGIVLNSVLTTRFEQTPEYDASGTDVIGSKFSMTFEGVCHGQGSRGADPTLPYIMAGGTATGGGLPTVQQSFNAISQALWQPRQKLTVSMGGAMLFVCNPSASGTPYDDIQNGPKPRGVKLTHITANNTLGPTFHVTFELECVRTACPNGRIPTVLNNRWSVQENFDDEYYTTRTISGQMRFSDSLPGNDEFRDLVVPSLEKGFKRARLDWNQHADGLIVDYVVTDQQVETAAPWPAAKMQVRHSIGTASGASFESECHVTLHGRPGGDKASLFALGLRIIENRLGSIKNMPGDNAMVPVAFSMVDVTGERNEIEVYLKVQHTAKDTGKGNISANWLQTLAPGAQGAAGAAGGCAFAAGQALGNQLGGGANNAGSASALTYLGTPVGNIGTPLDAATNPKKIAQGYSTDTNWIPNPWGYNPDGSARSSGIHKLLLECFLQTPCDDNHFFNNYSIPSAGSSESAPQPKPKTDTAVYNNPNVPPYTAASVQSLQNASASAPLFTHAAAETTLGTNPLRDVQMPIADDPTSWDGKKDTCVFVTLGLPQATITFHVECECVGQWPSVPEAVATFNDPQTGMKGSLISSVLSPMPPTTDATATKPLFHVSARITYGLNRPPLRTEKIPVGVLPWTAFTPAASAPKLSDLYSPAVQPFLGGAPQSTSGPKY